MGVIEGVICIDEGWAEIFHCLGGVLAVWHEVDACGRTTKFGGCEAWVALVLMEGRKEDMIGKGGVGGGLTLRSR